MSPESPALFIDIEAEVERICYAHNAVGVAVARTHSGRHAMWEDRHNLFFALKARSPGHRFLVTDVRRRHRLR